MTLKLFPAHVNPRTSPLLFRLRFEAYDSYLARKEEKKILILPLPLVNRSRLRMSSKRKSPPTKLSEGGGGTGTVAGANEEEEDTTSSVTGGPGGEVAVGEEGPTTPVDIEDCYPHQRGGDCESSGCSSPATTSEPDLRDSPSPSSNSLRTSKRQRIVLTGQEALAYHYPPHHHHYHHHHHHHHHHTNTSSSSGGVVEPASSSECGSPPTPLTVDPYYPTHPHHNNNNNTVTQNNNNNNNNNGGNATTATTKRSMDDVLKRLTFKMNSESLSLQDDTSNNRRNSPPPTSTPTGHNAHWLVSFSLFFNSIFYLGEAGFHELKFRTFTRKR